MRFFAPLVTAFIAVTAYGSDSQPLFSAAAMPVETTQGVPLLGDIFGSLRQCTIIGDYVRSAQTVSDRMVDSQRQTLILAPINSAIVSLPRKPWQDGPENAQDPRVDVMRNDDRASKNIEAFVDRHVIPMFPVEAGTTARNLAGQTLLFEIKDGDKYIDGKHKVLDEKLASNGAIWVISGVIEASGEYRHEGL